MIGGSLRAWKHLVLEKRSRLTQAGAELTDLLRIESIRQAAETRSNLRESVTHRADGIEINRLRPDISRDRSGLALQSSRKLLKLQPSETLHLLSQQSHLSAGTVCDPAGAPEASTHIVRAGELMAEVQDHGGDREL
jgi:hypothetical protein